MRPLLVGEDAGGERQHVADHHQQAAAQQRARQRAVRRLDLASEGGDRVEAGERPVRDRDHRGRLELCRPEPEVGGPRARQGRDHEREVGRHDEQAEAHEPAADERAREAVWRGEGEQQEEAVEVLGAARLVLVAQAAPEGGARLLVLGHESGTSHVAHAHAHEPVHVHVHVHVRKRERRSSSGKSPFPSEARLRAAVALPSAAPLLSGRPPIRCVADV